VISLPHEVLIANTTFIVNGFQSEDATETVDEILTRLIIKNAEQEFKKHPSIPADESAEMI
jgi:hypothetical protein